MYPACISALQASVSYPALTSDTTLGCTAMSAMAAVGSHRSYQEQADQHVEYPHAGRRQTGDRRTTAGSITASTEVHINPLKGVQWQPAPQSLSWEQLKAGPNGDGQAWQWHINPLSMPGAPFGVPPTPRRAAASMPGRLTTRLSVDVRNLPDWRSRRSLLGARTPHSDPGSNLTSPNGQYGTRYWQQMRRISKETAEMLKPPPSRARSLKGFAVDPYKVIRLGYCLLDLSAAP